MYKVEPSKLSWEILPCSTAIHPREKFSIEHYGNKVYLYGGVANSFHSNQLEVILFEDLIKENPASIHVTNISEPLMNHDSICSIDGLMMMFGGRTLQGLTNKLQVYDITKNVWFDLNTKGDVPTKRERHTTTLVEASLYIFGGLLETTNGKAEATNEFYKLAMETSSWQQVITKKKPKPRYGHTTVAINSKLIVFGGKSSNEALNDLPQFDVSKDAEWRIIKALGRSPEPRWGHSASVVSDKYMIVYGGWNGKTTLGDMFILDSSEYVWWEIILTNQIPRAYGRLFFKEDGVYYIGGRTDTEVRSEILKFDFTGLLSGGADQYSFDVESFTIKEKAKDEPQSLLDCYEFVRMLEYTTSESVYLVKEIIRLEEDKVPERGKTRNNSKKGTLLVGDGRGKSLDKLSVGSSKNLQSKKELPSVNNKRKIFPGTWKSTVLNDKEHSPPGKGTSDSVYYVIRRLKKDTIIASGMVEKVLSLRQIFPSLQHKFVLGTKNFYQDTRSLYIFTKPVPGGPMYNYLYKSDMKFTQNMIRFYATEIYLALTYIHSKDLIYRNLRPETICVTKNGHLKLVELGELKTVKETIKLHTIIGPPEYHSPEMIRNQEYGIEADWWAFGILLYEMHYKRTPFEHDDPLQVYNKILNEKIAFDEEIDEDLKSLISQLLALDPEKRLGFRGSIEIESHPFFEGVDFNGLHQKRVKAPFKPSQDIIDKFYQVEEDKAVHELLMDKEVSFGMINDPFREF